MYMCLAAVRIVQATNRTSSSKRENNKIDHIDICREIRYLCTSSVRPQQTPLLRRRKRILALKDALAQLRPVESSKRIEDED